MLDSDESRGYRLPAHGSKSMLFVFDGRQVGALAQSGEDFTPGSTHDAVTLTFWDEAARAMVRPAAPFEVWYGFSIGHGFVRSVGWLALG